ncbi:MFS transporter [Nocardia salmonicida]|uniref:MFS transporter n=1 Tax=Nocardia salmonicida TaxID=53431 RepID=UPI002E2911ED|nr:MFS transporter [Nocardia salmonicida]
MFAVVVQVTVAYVAAASAPGERGRNVGAVTSGVVIGILGARVVAGVLGDALGWRSVYVLLAVLYVTLALVTRGSLDPDIRTSGARYTQILPRWSLLSLAASWLLIARTGPTLALLVIGPPA